MVYLFLFHKDLTYMSGTELSSQLGCHLCFVRGFFFLNSSLLYQHPSLVHLLKADAYPIAFQDMDCRPNLMLHLFSTGLLLSARYMHVVTSGRSPTFLQLMIFIPVICSLFSVSLCRGLPRFFYSWYQVGEFYFSDSFNNQDASCLTLHYNWA